MDNTIYMSLDGIARLVTLLVAFSKDPQVKDIWFAMDTEYNPHIWLTANPPSDRNNIYYLPVNQ